MSHGAGLVRTTCSSGGGPGAGAGQSSARPSEGPLDPSYPRTYSALLKVAQMVTLLIAFICVRSSVWYSYSAYSYFQVVTICNLIMILVFYLVHLFRLYRLLTCISWPLSEFLHYLIGTLLLLIASIVAASKSYSQSGLVAGAIFGFVATFLCLASIWMSYKISCVTQSTGEFRLSEHR
ncbi:CKLF-like MARVEL transmembrane domain-containing protein 7 isoform X1 [Lutra lutra]|uniref:CKLF-like MARVEL transmembrane domain-containing protein 7 isoform X1 n=1 Tax=Lutra lutra TaxID=9657 RepID=UPI001FD07295|nr:CKLF-like MARVEL transmembrane domain-containing protein 7 isoform X1 [Lutra lutra]